MISVTRVPQTTYPFSVYIALTNRFARINLRFSKFDHHGFRIDRCYITSNFSVVYDNLNTSFHYVSVYVIISPYFLFSLHRT